jgi:hypothetical protein
MTPKFVDPYIYMTGERIRECMGFPWRAHLLLHDEPILSFFNQTEILSNDTNIRKSMHIYDRVKFENVWGFLEKPIYCYMMAIQGSTKSNDMKIPVKLKAN